MQPLTMTRLTRICWERLPDFRSAHSVLKSFGARSDTTPCSPNEIRARVIRHVRRANPSRFGATGSRSRRWKNPVAQPPPERCGHGGPARQQVRAGAALVAHPTARARTSSSGGFILGLRLCFFAFLVVAFSGPVCAQMVTGSRMENFANAFGITAKGWSVQETQCSLGANALWPGEKATFTFFLKPGKAFHGPVKVNVIQYGTKGTPGDWWKPVVFKIADTSSSTIDVDVPAAGGFVTVSPKIGDAFGGYALVFDLGERGRAFAGTCVRVPQPEPGRVWQPTYAMDLGWPHEMSPVGLQRLQAARRQRRPHRRRL